MLLKDIFKNIEIVDGCVEGVHSVLDIFQNSRECIKGSMYVAIVGEVSDGHNFIDNAIENGANTIVYSGFVDKRVDGVVYIKVANTRQAYALMCRNMFLPKQIIKMIGITGTNGKTTSAFMSKRILESCGKKVGLIGTIANYIGEEIIATDRTTPATKELYKLIARMQEEGCEFCVMEVSSHGSELDRAYGIFFESGIFTNLTQDHLDFHKTMDNYLNAKMKFLKGVGHASINMDCTYYSQVMNKLMGVSGNMDCTTFGIDGAYVSAKNVELSARGTSMDLLIGGNCCGTVSIELIGMYNVQNLLGVISALLRFLNKEQLVSGIANIGIIDGRCETVVCENLEPAVVIDYAHTPDGVENILKSIKAVANDDSNIIVVIGCGGNRDKTKRPIMAKIARENCDTLILTSDNPRFENPEEILNDMECGLTEFKKDSYIKIVDREEAIVQALKITQKEDIVVILGKGHETYQIFGDKVIDFSDKEVVLNFAKNLKIN